MLTSKRQRVRKGRQGFGIPGGLAHREWVFIEQLMGKNSHERKYPQKSGGGAHNGQIRPLALRFHAQMRAHLMKGDFHRPTHDKPVQDLN